MIAGLQMQRMKAALLQHLTSRQSSPEARHEAQPSGIEAFPTRRWESCFSLLERSNLRVQQRPEEPPSQPTSNFSLESRRSIQAPQLQSGGRDCCSLTARSCEALFELAVQAGCLPPQFESLVVQPFSFFNLFSAWLVADVGSRCSTVEEKGSPAFAFLLKLLPSA